MSWHSNETMKCSQSRGVTPPTLMCRPRRISCPTRVTMMVINIMVGSVARCDIFKSKLGNKANDAWIGGLQHPVGSFVHRPKFADERFDDDLRWIEHRIAGTGLQMRLLKAYSNDTLF